MYFPIENGDFTIAMLNYQRVCHGDVIELVDCDYHEPTIGLECVIEN